MKCRSCDAILNDFEATRRGLNTMEYIDLCTRCFKPLRDSVVTLDRPDLDHEEGDDEDYEEEFEEDREYDVDTEH